MPANPLNFEYAWPYNNLYPFHTNPSGGISNSAQRLTIIQNVNEVNVNDKKEFVSQNSNSSTNLTASQSSIPVVRSTSNLAFPLPFRAHNFVGVPFAHSYTAAPNMVAVATLPHAADQHSVSHEVGGSVSSEFTAFEREYGGVSLITYMSGTSADDLRKVVASFELDHLVIPNIDTIQISVMASALQFLHRTINAGHNFAELCVNSPFYEPKYHFKEIHCPPDEIIE